MLRSMCVLLLALAATPTVFGQTACPSGVAPGSPQCGSDAGTSRGAPAPAAPRPTGEWIKTWGAIADSETSDQAWASIGLLSKKEAEDDAIDQCQSAGMRGCKVTFTYRNQCVALASSTNARRASGVAGAPVVEQAEASALERCEKENGERCTVIYKDCTKPVFRKY